jgi:hypothetical protein
MTPCEYDHIAEASANYALAHVSYVPLPAKTSNLGVEEKPKQHNWMGRPPADRQIAVQAAVRRLPRYELAIHRLMDRDESFRDMCEELAEAELALSRVDTVSVALREARRAEWQDLVDRLVREVEEALKG